MAAERIFDLASNQLWQASVGSKTNEWGRDASPLLFQDLVIVNAALESDEVGPKFKLLAHNKFASDPTVFNASPAISGGRIYLRSDSGPLLRGM